MKLKQSKNKPNTGRSSSLNKIIMKLKYISEGLQIQLHYKFK